MNLSAGFETGAHEAPPNHHGDCGGAIQDWRDVSAGSRLVGVWLGATTKRVESPPSLALRARSRLCRGDGLVLCRSSQGVATWRLPGESQETTKNGRVRPCNKPTRGLLYTKSEAVDEGLIN